MEKNLQSIKYYSTLRRYKWSIYAIMSQFYDKSMWCGINVMWIGCASIWSKCLLRDLVNRLWLYVDCTLYTCTVKLLTSCSILSSWCQYVKNNHSTQKSQLELNQTNSYVKDFLFFGKIEKKNNLLSNIWSISIAFCFSFYAKYSLQIVSTWKDQFWIITQCTFFFYVQQFYRFFFFYLSLFRY